MWTVLNMSNVLHKTSLKIPKGLSEAVNPRKKKDKRTNNDLQNITQKCNNQAMQTPLRSRVNSGTPVG
jgi:hypothetical protein